MSARFPRWWLLVVALPILGGALALALLVDSARSPGEPRPAPAVSATPPSSPAADRLALKDGRVLWGEVLRQGPEHVVLRHPDGRVESIPRARIAELRLLPRPSGRRHRLVLRGGRRVEGELLTRTAERVELRLPNGNQVTFRLADVDAIEPLTE